MSHNTDNTVRAQKELFRAGLPVDTRIVRPEVLESWKRSLSYGLSFDKAKRKVLPLSALQERIVKRQTLYDIAKSFMESLHHFIRGSGFMALLSDEEGYVLSVKGDDDILRQTAEENELVPGCGRSERIHGTNAVGTVLESRQPMQLSADEHFYSLDQKWVCSGAPILDAHNNPIGVFCLNGLYDHVSYHTLGMAVAASVAIAEQMKMKQAYNDVEQIQKHMKIIVETMPSGVLLLNREQEIVQINTRATHMLELPSSRIVGRPVNEVIGNEILDAESMRQSYDDMNIMVERDGRNLSFSVSGRPSPDGDSVILFDKSDALHKKVTRFIGSDAYFTFSDIVGSAPAINDAVSLAKIAAGNASNVLITGESGTGKELFAQAIHNASERQDGPFVAINCGALPKSLIESELFGYDSGAFTGARRSGSAGKFELANHGTIFLDEIGDMPLDVQATLLRVLQNREVSRLGGKRPFKIDVRVIAATNKDLLGAIANSAFRSDLYYRLNVFNIRVPPLCERKSDIRRLADYFLHKYAAQAHKPAQAFSEEVYEFLENHFWPGNIRELENMVERAVYMCTGEVIGPKEMGQDCSAFCLREPNAAPALKDESFSIKPRNEAELIAAALRSTEGNMRQAAILLGISRRTLYRKRDKLGLNCAAMRAAGK